MEMITYMCLSLQNLKVVLKVGCSKLIVKLVVRLYQARRVSFQKLAGGKIKNLFF